MKTACPILATLAFDDLDILNVGFGAGWLELERMQGARSILGLDLRPENVTSLRDAWPADGPQATFVTADIKEYLLPPDAFELALFVDSF